MLNKYIHIFVSSLSVTILIGVITHRALPSWQLLIGDVGTEGAWTVSILYHLLYGVCIAVGNIGSCMSLKMNRTPLKSVIVSSIITIILLNTALSMYQPIFESILLFCLLLSACAFVISIVTLMVANAHNKSSNLTSAKNAPPS